MSSEIKVTCYEPALPIKICEGGWQLPEELQSEEPCEEVTTPSISGVETYCAKDISGSDLPFL